MTKKEYVSRYGGKFNIEKGEVWTMPNGHKVHFTLTPKQGSTDFNIATGWHEPGREFAPHVHPVSAELLVVYEGRGECYLKDRWIPCEKGDIIYAGYDVMDDDKSEFDPGEKGYFEMGMEE